VISFPPAKINLGLYITAQRPDGYHNLSTVFYPLPFTEILEIVRADSFSISITGNSIPYSHPDELSVVKAWKELKDGFPDLPPVKVHLHKVIPAGGGLGGGSSDGSSMLKLLNKKFALGLSDDNLREYALRLGSDSPFFISGKPALANGRGELLEEIGLDLSSFHFLIVNPGIHISTARAFASIRPRPFEGLKDLIQKDIRSWKEELKNDFEAPIFIGHPELGVIKEELYAAGALYASMSGSGSTMYGIFQEKCSLPSFPASYFVKWL
jgi:4-diphosphocytidyl-2-C-methyl-D-erythritol kinase